MSAKVGDRFVSAHYDQTSLLIWLTLTLTHLMPTLHAAGDVHVWDRETAALLRYLHPMNMPKLRDMTCIGWNNGMDEPMMFATGSHGGTVRVWSTGMMHRAEEEESSTEADSDG